VIDPIKDSRFVIVFRGRQVKNCALDFRIKKCEIQIEDFNQSNFLFSIWGESGQSLGEVLPRKTQ